MKAASMDSWSIAMAAADLGAFSALTVATAYHLLHDHSLSLSGDVYSRTSFRSRSLAVSAAHW